MRAPPRAAGRRRRHRPAATATRRPTRPDPTRHTPRADSRAGSPPPTRPYWKTEARGGERPGRLRRGSSRPIPGLEPTRAAEWKMAWWRERTRPQPHRIDGLVCTADAAAAARTEQARPAARLIRPATSD